MGGESNTVGSIFDVVARNEDVQKGIFIDKSEMRISKPETSGILHLKSASGAGTFCDIFKHQ